MSDIVAPSLASQTAPVVSRLSALRTAMMAWFVVDGLSRLLLIGIGLCVIDLALD